MSKLKYTIRTNTGENTDYQPKYFDAKIKFTKITHPLLSDTQKTLIKDMDLWCEENIGKLFQDYNHIFSNSHVSGNSFHFNNETDLTAFLIRWNQ